MNLHTKGPVLYPGAIELHIRRRVYDIPEYSFFADDSEIILGLWCVGELVGVYVGKEMAWYRLLALIQKVSNSE